MLWGEIKKILCGYPLLSVAKIASASTVDLNPESTGISMLHVTLLLLNTTCPVLANNVDPDHWLLKKPTDLDLHCLPLKM